MGFKQFKEIHKGSSHSTRTKNPAFAYGDKFTYENDGGRSLRAVHKSYINSVLPIVKSKDILGSIASSAIFSFKKEDSKGSKRSVKVKEFDNFKVNNKDSVADFIKLLIATLSTYKSCYIQVSKSTAKDRLGKLDFTILDNNKLTIEPSVKDTIEYFKYKGGDGTEVKIPKDEIIYISSNTDVSNYLYAINNLDALNYEIQGYLSANNMMVANNKQGGKKSTIISSEAMLSADQQVQIRDAITKFLNKNEASVLFLDESVKVSPVSDGLSGSQVLEQLTYINETILGMYNIPKFLYGDYSDLSSDSGIKTASRIFFEVALKPYFTTVSQHMTSYFRDQLGIKNILVEFDFSGINILEDSYVDLVEAGKTLHIQGIYSANEYRSSLGLEPLKIPSADIHILGQHIVGATPISLENFEEQTNLNTQLNTNQTHGNGGENNTEGLNGVQ